MQEVEGKRNGETEGQREDDPLVGAADAEHVAGEGAEGNCLVVFISNFDLSCGVRYLRWS